MSSVSTTASGSSDNSLDFANVSNRFGWPKQSEIEPSKSFTLEPVPNGRVESSSTSQAFLDKYKSRTESQGRDVVEGYFEPCEETCELDKQHQTRYVTQTNSRELTASQAKNSHSEKEVDAILKEENDLVNAHRKLIEDTMDIVREEMDLLVQVDSPENQLDEYIHKLNVILSHKAAGVVQLQNRLGQFRSHLHDCNILASSGQ